MQKGGAVYILTNKNHTALYTGVTRSLRERMFEHHTGKHKNAFTKKYNVTKLVYYKAYQHIEEAIAMEKKVKGMSRTKKEALVNGLNPEWKDLYEDVKEW